uniref:Trans-1,2-dihydrobenzene-1,2-diol dehydrogenase n=1 Tax=Cyclopterus lumpus TaxID=8103 RepID=A0A8C3APG7_CYCLU
MKLHVQVCGCGGSQIRGRSGVFKKHNISRAYGSYEELARDPDIDVVYVGVIHPYHLSTCLLFTNAKKNVLCEKPLAMNTKEVKEILTSAKRNDVFLMEAVWTRFLPASVEIKRLLAQGEVGEVKMVRSDFGMLLKDVPRSALKELGGGAMLDVGIYCLQFICMVYNGEKPECIQATGVCLETGVDETVVVTLKFLQEQAGSVYLLFRSPVAPMMPSSWGRRAASGSLPICGCPTSLVVNGKETSTHCQIPPLPINFLQQYRMRYEAEEVRQCLLKGLKESAVTSHADSLLLAEVEDEIRRQVGVVYSPGLPVM